MYINHTYKVPYNPQPDYKFEEYDEKIGVTAYAKPLLKEMESAVIELGRKKDSRAAVATLFRQDFHTCLLSVQFQIHEGTLYETVTLRSQAAVYRDRDAALFCYLADYVMKYLGQMKVDITVNVGNYHINRYNDEKL